MNMKVKIAEPTEDRAARVARDAERIAELAYAGFKGPVYEVFQIELYREAQPILLGMLRDGRLAQLALKHCRSNGWRFFVHEDDMRLLRSDPEARDQVLLDVLAAAMKRFLKELKAGKGWRADYEGPRGACSLMTYFIDKCVWSFPPAYTRWAKERVRWARQESAAHRAAILEPLVSTGWEAEVEAEVFGTKFDKILDEQAPETQAAVRLTIAGFTDTEIADRLHLKHGAVRMRKTRFRTALYKAAAEKRIWIPEQFHSRGGARRQKQRGVA
ncbi:hypothetical protein [Streptomyces sp. f51]|uniref:hypothetical protein n=1 Tax=Streptomyces sp. f51 TaxID=1827742 RepID=UPI000BF0965E|nr:hypothetical protein [Streptomyces sp. f51]